MLRHVRIEYEGAFYHVMASGNRRNRIVASPDGADEELFLKTLAERVTGSRLQIQESGCEVFFAI